MNVINLLFRLPNAGMRVELVDRTGQQLPSPINQFYALNNSSGGTYNWQDYSHNITVGAAYPEMYIRFYPFSYDNNPAYFDNYNFTFTTANAGVYQPELLSMADYYPHGSVMPGLNYQNSYQYKYGYQGQFAEMDKETNENSFELRNYDPLLGRFKTIDPYYQYWSPYMAMGNSHPNMVDENGGFSAGWAVAGAAVGFGVGVTGALIAEATGGNSSKWVDATPYLMLTGAVCFGFGQELSELRYAFEITAILLDNLDLALPKPNISGITVKLEVNNTKDNNRDFRWVQTVKSDKPSNGRKRRDTDGTKESYPFLYTPQYEELEGMGVTENGNKGMKDKPYRLISDGDFKWSAEISLVKRGRNGKYHSVGTYRYGFKRVNGKIIINKPFKKVFFRSNLHSRTVRRLPRAS